MSTILTLGSLRQEMTERMGQSPAIGTFTSAPGPNFTDTSRTEPDGGLNSFWLQDTQVGSGFPITRVNIWTQINTTGSLYIPLTGNVLTGDSYELTGNGMSFQEMRRAINSAISLCGKALRTLVRDESQSLVSNQYTYQANTDPSLPNAFFPRGVEKVSFEFWTGQPTREFENIPFFWIDDFTMQLPDYIVDQYASDTLRFQGYGPLTTRLTNDVPTQVIATFPDEFMIDALTWACVHHAWRIVAAKKTSGESTNEREMAQYALSQWQVALGNWRRGPTIQPEMQHAYVGGWGGN